MLRLLRGDVQKYEQWRILESLKSFLVGRGYDPDQVKRAVSVIVLPASAPCKDNGQVPEDATSDVDKPLSSDDGFGPSSHTGGAVASNLVLDDVFGELPAPKSYFICYILKRKMRRLHR